jgi:hypothetical protein
MRDLRREEGRNKTVRVCRLVASCTWTHLNLISSKAYSRHSLAAVGNTLRKPSYTSRANSGVSFWREQGRRGIDGGEVWVKARFDDGVRGERRREMGRRGTRCAEGGRDREMRRGSRVLYDEEKSGTVRREAEGRVREKARREIREREREGREGGGRDEAERETRQNVRRSRGL